MSGHVTSSLSLPTPADAGAARRVSWQEILAIALLVGHLTMSRSFAHLGRAPVFISEIALILLFASLGSRLVAPITNALLNRSPLDATAWTLCLFWAYGAVAVWRGIDAGHNLMTIAKTSVFFLYPLFLLVGLWLGQARPDLLRRGALAFAWIHGLYGVAYVGIFSNIPEAVEIDSVEVGWFGQPLGGAVAIIGLLCYAPDWRRAWLPAFLNALVVVALQVRAEWCALAIALLLWGTLAGRFVSILKGATIAAVLFAIALLADLGVPSPGTRGGVVSARSVLAKIVSPISTDLAVAIFPDAEELYANTVSWRTEWWKCIVADVHQSPSRALWGAGLGAPIWELHPEKLREDELRTPHNVLVFALANTGWVGTVLFLALQASLLGLLIQSWRATGETFGLCAATLLFVRSNFEDFFEAPFGAIPYYLLVGIAIAPVATAWLAPATQPDSMMREST